jgi:fido (protein-threonine AMPylation protein)
LLHFMLAYDHPFVDGSGRTARLLFYWSMQVRQALKAASHRFNVRQLALLARACPLRPACSAGTPPGPSARRSGP